MDDEAKLTLHGLVQVHMSRLERLFFLVNDHFVIYVLLFFSSITSS